MTFRPDRTTSPAARLRFRDRLLVVVPAALFVAATTNWMPWAEPIRERFAADVDDYERIARAAPHFTWPQIVGHVGMWPVHYAVGVVHDVTRIPLHATYWLAAAIVLVAIVVLVDRILERIHVGPRVYAVCAVALLMNPYVFRYLAIAPGMINDAVFIAAVSLVTWAVVADRLGWAYVGLALAALARGWSVPPVAVALALWLGASRRPRAAVGAVAVPALVFALAYWLGLRAPGHAEAVKGCCSLGEITVWADLRGLPSSAGTVAIHVARVLTGLTLPLALLAAAAWLVGRADPRAARVPRVVYALLLLAAAMVAQPLVLSSAWNAGAEPRLASFAVAPVVAAAGILLQSLVDGGDLELRRSDVAALVGISAVASLSHRFAAVGPRTADQFAGLELVCALAVALVVLRAGRRVGGRRPAAAAEGAG